MDKNSSEILLAEKSAERKATLNQTPELEIFNLEEQGNLAKFENEMESRKAEFFDLNGVRPVFFREIIERFKTENGKLECTA